MNDNILKITNIFKEGTFERLWDNFDWAGDIIFFGSYANNRETEKSDIDLMVSECLGVPEALTEEEHEKFIGERVDALLKFLESNRVGNTPIDIKINWSTCEDFFGLGKYSGDEAYTLFHLYECDLETYYYLYKSGSVEKFGE